LECGAAPLAKAFGAAPLFFCPRNTRHGRQARKDAKNSRKFEARIHEFTQIDSSLLKFVIIGVIRVLLFFFKLRNPRNPQPARRCDGALQRSRLNRRKQR
jgi:hypothetical protein